MGGCQKTQTVGLKIVEPLNVFRRPRILTVHPAVVIAGQCSIQLIAQPQQIRSIGMPTDKLLRGVQYERHQYTLRGAQ